nr:MAG TPA: hypothetical protein [Caudoviricetes sp.]
MQLSTMVLLRQNDIIVIYYLHLLNNSIFKYCCQYSILLYVLMLCLHTDIDQAHISTIPLS